MDISPGFTARPARYARARYLSTLDGARDHLRIYRISTGLEFPWDYQRSLELALLRMFAVPEVAGLIDATGHFARDGQRRYDDTLALLAALAKYGYDSPEGRIALRTVNRAHSWYAIRNDHMLYTLSALVCEPVRWIGRYGWRPLLEQEKTAAFCFYREVGRRMNVKDIPEDFAGLERFNREYERTRFARSATGRKVADYVLGIASSWVAAPARPIARKGVVSLMDEPLRRAFAYLEPTLARPCVEGALRLRAKCLRLWPPRRNSYYDAPPRLRSYPGTHHQYTVADFGVTSPSAVDPRWLRNP
ncbi:oxygenase MpaB family protein [Streptomyces stramineus]|uniref:Oxygenase MpaB family protein n=1 Tax=Streptomyces stramineus TaxID=173861 RepID=A0ABN1A4K5_9ACTN